MIETKFKSIEDNDLNHPTSLGKAGGKKTAITQSKPMHISYFDTKKKSLDPQLLTTYESFKKDFNFFVSPRTSSDNVFKPNSKQSYETGVNNEIMKKSKTNFSPSLTNISSIKMQSTVSSKMGNGKENRSEVEVGYFSPKPPNSIEKRNSKRDSFINGFEVNSGERMPGNIENSHILQQYEQINSKLRLSKSKPKSSENMLNETPVSSRAGCLSYGKNMNSNNSVANKTKKTGKSTKFNNYISNNGEPSNNLKTKKALRVNTGSNLVSNNISNISNGNNSSQLSSFKREKNISP